MPRTSARTWDGTGTLIFDVNDFDEAYLRYFSWDLQRLAASIALLGWRKALPDEVIEEFVLQTAFAYVQQVRAFSAREGDADFALRLDTTDGAVHRVLQNARLRSRHVMLESMTETVGCTRRFREGSGIRRLESGERADVVAAYARYLDTIPEDKQMRGVAYTVKDAVGRSGFGIGSAGLPAYNVLIEGANGALENDLVLSMQQGNVAAPSRIVHDERIHEYFRHHGLRTAESQRALQAHADLLLGHTELHGCGYVISELSPYEQDLDWGDRTEPDDIAPRPALPRPGRGEDPLRVGLRLRPHSGAVSDRGGHRERRPGPGERVRAVTGPLRHGVRGHRPARSPVVRRGVPWR